MALSGLNVLNVGGSGFSYFSSLRSLTNDFGLSAAEVPKPFLGEGRALAELHYHVMTPRTAPDAMLRLGDELAKKVLERIRSCVQQRSVAILSSDAARCCHQLRDGGYDARLHRRRPACLPEAISACAIHGQRRN